VINPQLLASSSGSRDLSLLILQPANGPANPHLSNTAEHPASGSANSISAERRQRKSGGREPLRLMRRNGLEPADNGTAAAQSFNHPRFLAKANKGFPFMLRSRCTFLFHRPAGVTESASPRLRHPRMRASFQTPQQRIEPPQSVQRSLMPDNGAGHRNKLRGTVTCPCARTAELTPNRSGEWLVSPHKDRFGREMPAARNCRAASRTLLRPCQSWASDCAGADQNNV